MKKYLLFIALLLGMVGEGFSFCIIRSNGWNDGQTRCCDGLIRWWHPSTLPVPITVNETGSKQAPGDLTVNAVRRALQTWTAVPSSFFAFSFAGTTDQNYSANDGINIVVFDVRGENFAVGTTTLAFSRTMVRFDSPGYRATDSDMVFNARDYQWSVDGGASAFDIETVALHEFGHHLGLDHPGGHRDIDAANSGCGPVVNTAVMYYAVAPNSRKRILRADDLAGLTQIYPNWILAGNAWDGATGLPLGNAPVHLHGTVVPRDTIAVTTIATDENGWFEAPVVDSLFSVSLALFGYAPSETTQVHFQSPGVLGVDFVLQPLELGALEGVVRDRLSGTPVQAELDLYVGESIYRNTMTDSAGGYRFADLPETQIATTRYDRLVVRPQIPYPVIEIEDGLFVRSGQTTRADVDLDVADLLLVDDDGGDRYERFYTDALDEIGTSYVQWNKQSQGSASATVPFFDTRTVVWMSGDRNETLLDEELDSLHVHLQRGGSLLISGQNIAEKLEERQSAFLQDILRVQWQRNIQDPILHGVKSDPLGKQMPSLALTGGNSAWNQRSPDVLLPLSGAEVFVVYDTTRNDAAAVRVEEAIAGVTGSRLLFFAFGIEGINGLASGFSSKKAVLQASIDWLNDQTTSVEPEAPVVSTPERFVLYPSYPNPFNSETSIRFSLANQGGVQTVVRLYDLLGREIRTLFDRSNAVAGDYRVKWDGRLENGQAAPSGIYFCRLQSGNHSALTKVMLVR
ncbi:T9SS type A sorting domain-containing protein [candidate division KSB1 bacterium]|nr:T9SS type A sorting domain-containing protein [candidate division KSB1 bacterium]